ncbi:response regulator transcription factor [Salinibacterium sp. dk2585]|uniref:response regulator transcription factor n=1 Tax=unclassified Salinibacterium TaxID=2632331 RepID=UPI0011C25696|nr:MULTISPECIES: response regulator transcription factor [unclassified Salinibacterium]QEE60875.1 response regulator transcription factor [Salinibacterium sp. dk2585]TXK55946.1 response regulator transcription factor [Salinibacterium sp. dk5596]
MARILVAEDEDRISSFVEKGLRAAGFGVSIERDGPGALTAARTGQFDLMVLDLGLPGYDGFDVLQQLRAEGNAMAVIILTARDSAQDAVAGFEGGANDYVSKPFRFDELLARVRVRLQDTQTDTPRNDNLSFVDLELDLKTRRVRSGGVEVDLSAREFALLEEFMLHPEQVLSREQLLSRVWGFDFDPGSNVVDVYVRYLRQKIGRHRLETVRGMGYRLTSRQAG